MENQVVPTENPDLLPEKRAAQFLGISQMSLIRKRRKQEVAFYQVGARCLYSKLNHLIPFLEACEQKAKGSL